LDIDLILDIAYKFLNPPQYILSEADLVQKLINKEQTGISYLYDKYASALYGTALRMVGKEEFAQEILQDTFLNIWDKIAQFDARKGKLFTWMINIVRNKSIDKMRSSEFRKMTKSEPIDTVVYTVDRENQYEQNIDALGLEDHLAVLNDDQQFVLKMIYFRGYTHNEVAEKFGMPLGTVKTRVRNGLKALRKIMRIN